MAGKNVGVTLLSVVVAVSAFVASSIWRENLQDRIVKAHDATQEWTQTYNSINDRSLVLGGEPAPTDLADTKQRLSRKLQFIKEVIGVIIPGLIRAQNVEGKLLKVNEDMLDHYGQLAQQSLDIKSLNQAVALDNEATGLLGKEIELGVLLNSYALQQEEDLEGRASYIKYIGYSLSVLAIIVAGIAQIAG